MTQERVPDENKAKVLKPEASAAEAKHEAADPAVDISGLRSLQQSIGNRAVQRMLAQRSGTSPSVRRGTRKAKSTISAACAYTP